MVLLSIFILESAAIFAWGMAKAGRIYEFPFLVSCTFLGWVLPQLIGLIHENALEATALDRTILMCILCQLMGCLGYAWPSRGWTCFTRPSDPGKLTRFSVVLCLVSLVALSFLNRLPEDLAPKIGIWEGPAVIYNFFLQFIGYGYGIALILYLRNRYKPSLWPVAMGGMFYLFRAVFVARRGDTLEFFFITISSIWLVKRKGLPRWGMIACILLGTMAVNNIGQYRALVLLPESPDWTGLGRIDFSGDLHAVLKNGGEELKNASMYMEAVEKSGDFDLGAFHWNSFISAFVPRQLLGGEFKNSLLIEAGNYHELAQDLYGYDEVPGSTATGMTDCFSSFWYFGCLKFFLIGTVMKKFFLAAAKNNYFSQLSYVLLLTPSLHAITHHTQWFFNKWFVILAVTLPIFYLSRSSIKARPEGWPPAD